MGGKGTTPSVAEAEQIPRSLRFESAALLAQGFLRVPLQQARDQGALAEALS
jgi:hypothetical protein